jgi:hypothetical protein
MWRRAFFLSMCGLVALGAVLRGGRGVEAQTLTPDTFFAVRLLVLDANGDPVANLGLELILIQYGDAVQLFWAGACVTDTSGSCVITANLPPSIAPDWYEGVVYVQDLGRQVVGWRGAEALLTLQLAADGRVPTEEPDLHPPYDTQPNSPTEVPLGTRLPTETPRVASATPLGEATHPLATPTASPTPTAHVTPTPLSPGQAQAPESFVLRVGLGLLLGGLLLATIITLLRKKS